MKKKALALIATSTLAGGMLFVGASPASAAHYCKVTPAGIMQTNGNGARGGSDGWLNSSSGIENAERAGALQDCGEFGIAPPESNRKGPRGR